MPLSRTLNGDFDFSQLKQKWMGEWNEGVIYAINDTVRLNGKAYVCNSTYFTENNLFGHENKPGVDTTNWTLVINGSVYKGDWAYKDRHYVGDIVRFNGDYYQCLVDNYGGHPIYENGALSTKWTKIAQTSRIDRDRQHVWFTNYPPIGWTRNLCETVEQYGQAGSVNVATINGNYQLCFTGRNYGDNGFGFGERTTWLASNDANASGTWQYVLNAGFDHWDWLDGYRPSITGGEPRIVQVSGTDTFTLVLFDTGEVYHTGYGGHGQNGDATTSTWQYFRRVGRSGARGTGALRDKRIIKVGHSAKNGHMGEIDTHSCFALADDGTVWTWGYNGYGQLGHGNTSNYSTPTQISQAWFHNKKIVDMWMFGYDYQSTMCQTEDGELYAFGYNGNGMLGCGHFYNQYRPERVPVNWAKFGGIKKLIAAGSGAESVVVVLTNNGELHMTGNTADGSYPIYGHGAGPDNSYRPTFQPAARLYQIRANARGIGNKTNEYGIMFDVMRKVDDFWLISNGTVHALAIKEIGTGLMYGVGQQFYNIFPTYGKQLGYNEYPGDNQYYYPNLSAPTLLHMGNMTDIKYVHRYGQSTYVTVCYMNSDGRIWTNASNGHWARGIGANGPADPTSQVIRGSRNRLPWEHWFRSNSWTQPRWAEPFTLITGITNDGSSGGFGCLTTNGRFVSAFGGVSWYYGWDPASNPSQVGYSHGNYQRHSL